MICEKNCYPKNKKCFIIQKKEMEMTQKNKMVKHIADIIGVAIGWMMFFIFTVIVCDFMGWNPMQETLVSVSVSLYTVWRILDLSDKFEG